MKLAKRILSILMAVLLIFSIPSYAFAHGGRTDSSGGHNDNRNKSGLGYYHYHCGGHPAHLHEDGICPYDPKDTIVVDNMPKTMTVGEEINLTWNVTSYSWDTSVTWSSSDYSIVSVTEDGIIQANEEGKAKITADLYNGRKTYTITVKPVYVNKIVMTDIAPIEVGDIVNVEYDVFPSDATYNKLIWKSSNPKVVTVDENGTITAISNGGATITSTSQDSKHKSQSIKIAVVTLCKSLEISGAEQIQSGKKVKLTSTAFPIDATNKRVTWSSSDTKIATVDSKGYVTAKKTAKDVYITITATSIDGSGLTATYTILITAAPKK